MADWASYMGSWCTLTAAAVHAIPNSFEVIFSTSGQLDRAVR